jgi:hypothetical protein
MPPRFAALPAAVTLAAICFIFPAQASDTCNRATGGKCKVGQSAAPAKTKSGAVTRKPGEPKGTRLKSRSQYTAAEREKIMERAREICRKYEGGPSRVYKIDYATSRVWCAPASY